MFAGYFTISVKPKDRAVFLETCLEEARASARDEPDCYRFEVFQDKNDENRFCFLEVFKDEQALEAHYETPHFVKMWQIIEPMIDGELGQTNMDFLYTSDTSLGS